VEALERALAAPLARTQARVHAHVLLAALGAGTHHRAAAAELAPHLAEEIDRRIADPPDTTVAAILGVAPPTADRPATGARRMLRRNRRG
jgi:hypothetical protein